MREVKINYTKDGYQAIGDYETIKKMVVLASKNRQRWFAVFTPDDKNCKIKVRRRDYENIQNKQ